ncbi:MAG TPA: CHAD domain-containing protein [Vicinamibacterales bacterium]|nr:CHAD domain-containing protein [Vicinamibacterales bacterium]
MTRANLSELLIGQRLGALGRALPRARKGDVAAVHSARVATRRLREALPVLAGGKVGRKLRKRMRRLTRALGPVRELDVALITLDELRASGDVGDAAIARLQQVVREERERLLIEMRSQIDRCDMHKLEKTALSATIRVSEKRRSDRRRVVQADRRAAHRGADLQAAIRNAAGIYLPDRLHFVRVAVKKLRYAMEIARDLRGSRAMAHLRTLQRVQDVLGRIHDLEVLIARTRAVQSTGPVRDLKLSADLDRLVRRLETECRQLHVRYMNERRALLTICDHVVGLAQQHRDSRASAA